MKKYLTFSIAMLYGLAIGITALHAGTNLSGISKTLKPGERPPIDIRTVPDDAFERGIIQVKLYFEMKSVMQEGVITAGSRGYVELQHPQLDALNQQFGVESYRPLLHNYYAQKQVSPIQMQRHMDFGLDRWYRITISDDSDVRMAVKAFAQLPEVEIAEPIYRVELFEPISVEPLGGDPVILSGSQPNDNFYYLQWGFKNDGQDIRGVLGLAGADISAEAAWDSIKGNPDVVVAIIDTGVQYDHPDLADNVWPGIGPEGTLTSPHNHATHVAGTVAAVSNNSIGVAGMAGGDGTPGSGVKVMSLDMFFGEHGMTIEELKIYAADNGAAISQNSWGYSEAGFYNQSVLDGIDYFNEFGGGDVMDGGITIFSAGNTNRDEERYPAYYSGAFAVASSDNRDLKSTFSSYGDYVDVTAPGTNIVSTITGSNYGYLSGTSMAAPHVSGTAALVLSYAPGLLTNEQLWEILRASVDDFYPLNPNYAGKLGTGRLNAAKAIEAAASLKGYLTGPLSFYARTSGDRDITLSWRANFTDNPVLVAWSLDESFGEPENGVVYAAGETLPGGGQVLYFGDNQDQFQHMNLEYTTTYYYRAWSYDGENYSIHKEANASTLCPGTYSLPYTQNFNSSNEIPLCWESTGTAAWNIGTFSNGLKGSAGNYAWVELSGNSANNAGLVSPSFDFTFLTDITVEFRHRYNHDRSTASFQFSTDDGVSWTNIQTWSSNTGTTVFSNLVEQLAGSSNVKFRWNLDFSGGGSPNRSRSWSIDDIVITGQAAGITYTISATSSIGGSINPSGNILVPESGSQSFSFTAEDGYELEDVIVDGVSVGIIEAYTFNDVNENHTIHAVFEFIPPAIYTITATATEGGFISPSGVIEIMEGQSITIWSIHYDDYILADVIVNGVSTGANRSYTFNNVMADHTIHAVFVEMPEDPCKIIYLPYTQTFDVFFETPECWDIDNPEGDVTWTFYAMNAFPLFNTNPPYAFYEHTGNQPGIGDLFSPTFDFSERSSVQLQFLHRYYHDRSTAELSYSTDGKNTWNLIQSWNQSTSPSEIFSQYLDFLAGESQVIFRWRVIAHGSGPPHSRRTWNVDNVHVSGALSDQAAENDSFVNVLPVQEDLQIGVFPNPVQGRVFIQPNMEIENGLISIFDLQGREMIRTVIKETHQGELIELNLNALNTGIYLVRLISESGSVTQRISVK